eukprot:1151105-Pelagomonas_calceolata.AAC.3
MVSLVYPLTGQGLHLTRAIEEPSCSVPPNALQSENGVAKAEAIPTILSGDEIVTAAASIPPLRALSVSMCTSVTDASISALAAQKPDLQELKLDWCSKVIGVKDCAVVGLGIHARALAGMSLSAEMCLCFLCFFLWGT